MLRGVDIVNTFNMQDNITLVPVRLATCTDPHRLVCPKEDQLADLSQQAYILVIPSNFEVTSQPMVSDNNTQDQQFFCCRVITP